MSGLSSNSTDDKSPISEAVVVRRSTGFIYKENKKEETLFKIFTNLPPQTLSSAEIEDGFLDEFMSKFAFWKRSVPKFDLPSSKLYQALRPLAYNYENEETILPCIVYEKVKLAKDFLREDKDYNLLSMFLHIAKQIAKMHDRLIIHGDLRGDNILIDGEGFPHIADNFLTEIISILDRREERVDTEVCGAIRWMPVEDVILQGSIARKPTKAGDIWSFGMTMFELWSGNVPYYGIPTERVALMISQERTPSTPKNPPHKKLEKIIHYLTGLCWALRPEERVATDTLINILTDLVRGDDLDTVKRNYAPKDKVLERLPEFTESPTYSSDSSSSDDSYTPPSSELSSLSSPISERSQKGRYPLNVIPPHPSCGTQSAMTLLMNTQARLKNLGDLEVGPSVMAGDDHNPMWTTVIRLNGHAIGEGKGARKKESAEIAAKQAMGVLSERFESVRGLNRVSYTAQFKDYIERNELQARIKFKRSSEGEAHLSVWVVQIYLDGEVLTTGSGSTLKLAEEKAALILYYATTLQNCFALMETP
ncbi:hypothetical protein PNOK_0952200 [Pyrrhoderma noxium]|uniref:Uncharacterized protein n=1 Tax=Pyrrhoderma noxium TaxID=2282107 RepID=A0A286U611_9AGAM|nr:hypothetical protein PNOK_0952200 [Pyrrhoderma noxium]